MSARRLGLAVVLAPLAWLAYLQIAYALVPVACRHPGALTGVGSGVFFALVAIAGILPLFLLAPCE